MDRKREQAVALWAVLGALVVGAATAAAGSGAQEALATAERAFARMAAEQGVKPAFLAFLDDDSVIFRPRAVPGKSWTRDHPPPAIRLAWSPTFVQVAQAADLGYTTGPYELRRTDPKDPDVVYGRYVTVWRRRPAGPWRAVFDVGVTAPQPAADAGSTLEYGRPLAAVPEADVAPAGSSAPTASSGPGDKERDALLAADRAFAADVAARGAADAYAAHLGENARLLRDGRAPIVGAAAIRAALAAEALKLGWQPTGGGVAGSRDLGYTYGTATFARLAGGPTLDACYLRLWERSPGGDWKIVLDLLNPLPPPPPEAI